MPEYFANAPISTPVQAGQNLDVDLDGFGWDNESGLFVPSSGDVSTFILPYDAPEVTS